MAESAAGAKETTLGSLKTVFSETIGGILSAIIALPLALAFGVASGLGATAGLYGAIACGLVAAVLGGAPAMISGPTGPVTVMVAALVSAHTGHPELAFAAGIAAGLFQIILGKLKMGQLIQYMPHPVLSGFMSGIGVIIITIQLLPLGGLSSEGELFVDLQSFLSSISRPNPSALLLGFATIATVYLSRFLPLKIPPLLVALLAGTGASLYFNMDIPRIGEIPSGLPSVKIPAFPIEHLHVVLSSGLSIAIVGAIDSLLTALVVDKVSKNRHNSDKEMLAQGFANIASGLIGGISCSGTTMPSMVNVSSGARKSVSGILCALILLAILLGLGRFASQIPLCVLAGILITVGIAIIDKKTIMQIGSAPKSDTLVMLIVLGLTVFVDLMLAVAVGVALASTLFAKRLADSKRSTVSKLETLEEVRSLTEKVPPDLREQLYLYDFVGPLFFGEVKNFLDVWSKLEDAQVVILRFHNVPFIDQSGAYALKDAFDSRQGIPCGLLFVGLGDSIEELLHSLDLDLNDRNSFDTLEEAVQEIIGRLPSLDGKSDADRSAAACN